MYSGQVFLAEICTLTLNSGTENSGMDIFPGLCILFQTTTCSIDQSLGQNWIFFLFQIKSIILTLSFKQEAKWP